MRSALAVTVLAASIATCGGSRVRLFPAGTDKDEGHGDLARASAKLMTSDGDLFAESAPDPRPDRAYGGAKYGADYVVPQWTYRSIDRTPNYSVLHGRSGAIEGTVRWRGPVPRKRGSICGPVETVRIGADRGIAGVVVYIERVAVGRALPNAGVLVDVGGVIIKQPCALVPAAQIVAPLPAPLAIHGDAARAQLRITGPTQATTIVELEQAGRATLKVDPGITRIDDVDGALASAWVIALEIPYYAITDDAGRFRIDELAPGTYEVTIWHAPIADPAPGPIHYGAPIVVRRRVRVDVARAAKLDVALGR